MPMIQRVRGAFPSVRTMTLKKKRASLPEANRGTVDRVLRAIVAILLISLVFIAPQTLWG